MDSHENFHQSIKFYSTYLNQNVCQVCHPPTLTLNQTAISYFCFLSISILPGRIQASSIVTTMEGRTQCDPCWREEVSPTDKADSKVGCCASLWGVTGLRPFASNVHLKDHKPRQDPHFYILEIRATFTSSSHTQIPKDFFKCCSLGLNSEEVYSNSWVLCGQFNLSLSDLCFS